MFFQAACPYGVWQVQPGNTLYQIAQMTGTTVYVIMQSNPGLNPYNLQVGQVLCLPPLKTAPPPPCQSGIYWTVAPGDTLYSIAQSMGTLVEKLLALNPGINPANLPIGLNICLPE